jgi:hypothetical protein
MGSKRLVMEQSGSASLRPGALLLPPAVTAPHREKTLETVENEDMFEGISERPNSRIQSLKSRPARPSYMTNPKL